MSKDIYLMAGAKVTLSETGVVCRLSRRVDV